MHNLTDEDYPISKKEGLIWVEFTKISKQPCKGRKPSGTGFWDIDKFIERASKQDGKTRVPIRSSIPTSIEGARKVAEDAGKQVKLFAGIGWVAFIIAVVSFVGLVWTTYDNLKSASGLVENQVRDARSRADDAYDKSRSNENGIKILQLKLDHMKNDIQELRNQPTDTERQDSLKK